MAQPIGIDDTPFFSYKLEAKCSGETLKAYQIIVRNEQEVVWDSGYIEEDRQILIKYEGNELKPQTKYLWKVVVWNQNGEMSESDENYFETG